MRMITMFAVTALFALTALVIAQDIGGGGLLGAGLDRGAAGAGTDLGSSSGGGPAATGAKGSLQPLAANAGSPPDTKPPATADIPAGQPDFPTLISAIKASEANADKIRKLEKVTAVKVVQISEVGGDENFQAEARALENAVSRNQMDVEDLRAAIVSNETLTSALDNKRVPLDNVIAVKVDAGGKVTLFTRQG